MKRKNGEGSWETKPIKGVVYQYYRSPDNKYTYGRTIKEVKEKLKNNANKTNASKANTLKSYGMHWLQNVKALELEARTYDEYENIIEKRQVERCLTRMLKNSNCDRKDYTPHSEMIMALY